MLRALAIAMWLIGMTVPAEAAITRIWLTHQREQPTHLVVNWQTDQALPSLVEYGPDEKLTERVADQRAVTLHHVELPIEKRGVYHYRVSSGEEKSEVYRFKFYPDEQLRVGVVADWQGKPKLDALLKDDIHLLIVAGDQVAALHSAKKVGDKENVEPFARLIDTYPELFRSVPVMPALGNHDREIRPRGSEPPKEAVYDVDASAFRAFYPLPGDGWKWTFELPDFDVRFIAIDLNHTSDFGTTWQTCHAFDPDSEQFRWYDKVSSQHDRSYVVSIYNEQNRSVRSQAKGAWGKMIERGTIAITGFGYFAERAEANGFPYFNTALGAGAVYKDPQSRFVAAQPSYVLLTFEPKQPMRVELKDLAGEALDKTSWPGRSAK